jgi:hypothetical protein
MRACKVQDCTTLSARGLGSNNNINGDYPENSEFHFFDPKLDPRLNLPQ